VPNSLGVGLQMSMIGEAFRPDFRHGRNVMPDIKRIRCPVAVPTVTK